MAAVKKTGRKPTGAAAMGPGPGRPKGSQNKVTKQLKDMILGALADAGGQDYLTECAMDPKTRSAYLTLLGKVLPTEQRLANPDGSPLQGLAAAPVFNVSLSTTESPKKK
jgi:hypothetical protein